MFVLVNFGGDKPHRWGSISVKQVDNPFHLAILDVSETSCMVGLDDSFYVNRINVPTPVRGRGIGTALMASLARKADEEGLTLYIDPTANYGSDVTRLTAFFQRFGFVANPNPMPGSGSMIRLPWAGSIAVNAATS